MDKFLEKYNLLKGLKILENLINPMQLNNLKL